MKIIFVLSLLLLVPCQAKTSLPKYYRSHWKHWLDTNHNCLNTRHEILKSRSLEPVKVTKRGCHVKQGKWQDYYYPETHTLASKIDIDHLIPLKHAHDSGGSHWTPAMKQAFANDPENLVITYKVYNRSKGPKTISEWLPVNKEYACKYIHDWVKIKSKYKLQIGEAEKLTIEAGRCH